MGTNYYVIEKTKNELNIKLNQIINTIDTEKLVSKIEDVIKSNYKDVINILNENQLDHQLEMFNVTLKETISNIKSDLDYKLKFEIDIKNQYAKHIGKSSAGWLFCFQEQNEWDTYEEFKTYITSTEFRERYDIIDAYDDLVSPEEMIEIIDTKQNNERNKANPDNFTYSKNVKGYRFSEGDFS